MSRLDGKVALVSGAARGMGEAIARRLVADGATVVLGDVLDDLVKEVADDLSTEAADGRADQATAIRLDVTSSEDWEAAVGLAEREFGHLDVLVNNAGILKFGTVADMPAEEFEQLIAVNQVGVWLGMKHATPALERAGAGSAIVNISSVEGLGGGALLSAYTATKFAVRGMTKAAALELGPKGIRVNSVHPGAVKTDMVLSQTGGDPSAEKWMGNKTALGRMGEPHEIAAVVAFLASDDASYMTGSEVVVDGGVTASSGFKE